MLQKKKLSKRLLAIIIPISVTAVILSAILIMNIFIPVKYLSAYINLSTDRSREGEMRISFIDVGDGDCTLIEFPDGKVALIDGGSGSYNNQLKIFKKLNSSKINKIDYLFCTSSATKSCSGLAEIVKYKNIGKVYAPIYKNTEATDAYRNFVKEVANKNKEINEISYGTGCYSKEYGYGIWVLYPSKSVSDGGDNVRATAIWISYGGTNVLMLGDLSSSETLKLLDAYTVSGFEIDGHSIILEDCNVIKVPGGIAAGGALIALCDLIQPETAILSTDATFSLNADIGHFANGSIYRTGINGTVTLIISDGNYAVKKER